MDDQIRRIQKEMEQAFEEKVAEFAIKVISDAQLNSRTDTGKYKGSWRASKGYIEQSTGQDLIENESVLKAKLITKKPFETVYIVNVADYSKVLEAKDSTLSNAIFRAINT